eukprot:m.173349 g.173349  ORF g.173349 m.173349 type:complete len:602 (+) comp17314_c2_seq6:241-2046(+)
MSAAAAASPAASSSNTNSMNGGLTVAANSPATTARASEAELLAMLEAQNRMLAQDVRAVTTMTVTVTENGGGDGSTNNSLDNGSVDGGSHGSGAGAEAAEPEGGNIMVHWIEALSTWDVFTKKRQKRLHELVMEGVPEQLRCMAWQLMAKTKAGLPADEPLVSLIARDGSDSECPSYVDLLKLTSPHEKYINRDIDRTYPNHSFFAERGGMGQENLFNVIKAYSLYDTEVGYCQGCPFIVGVLLMHMPEDEAFYMFTSIMRDYKLRGLYRPSMADMPLRLFQLEGLIAQGFPELHAHFAEIGVSVATFASSWFLTLFGSTLPLPIVFRLLDVFFVDGMHVIFRAAMAILANSHDYLLRNNVEGVLRLLMKNGLAEKYNNREAEFMAEFAQTKVDHKRLQKLEKDYTMAKMKTDMEQSELTKKNQEIEHLREENKNLKDKVALLEREMTLMATKLLNTSVTLNKKEEELYDTRQAMQKAVSGLALSSSDADHEHTRGTSADSTAGATLAPSSERTSNSSTSALLLPGSSLPSGHTSTASSSSHLKETHSGGAKETLTMAKDAILQLIPTPFRSSSNKEHHREPSGHVSPTLPQTPGSKRDLR